MQTSFRDLDKAYFSLVVVKWDNMDKEEKISSVGFISKSQFLVHPGITSQEYCIKWCSSCEDFLHIQSPRERKRTESKTRSHSQLVTYWSLVRTTWRHFFKISRFKIQDFICHIHNYTEYNQQWNVSQVRSMDSAIIWNTNTKNIHKYIKKKKWSRK